MSWRGRHVYLPLMRRAYTSFKIGDVQKLKTGLTQNTLDDINASPSRPSRIEAALDRNLFALATLISLTRPSVQLSLELQQRIVRGLSQYHPRLMPVNLNALVELHKSTNCDIPSIDKAMLVKSLIAYGDQQLIRSGFDLIHRAKGGPIPSSAVMHLVSFAKEKHSTESCVLLWEYLSERYPLTLPEYSALMVDLMEVFARSRTYSSYAGRVARACLGNASNPAISLGIAKVSYVTQDKSLMDDLVSSPGFKSTRVIEGFQALLLAKLNGPMPDLQLTPQESSSLIKIVAQADVQAAEKLEADSEASELPKEQSILAQIALCNQYIQGGNLTKYNESMRFLRASQRLEGIQLNLKLKWELLHGSFRFAKRHYQNFPNVPHKQRVIALNALSSLAQDTESKEWVACERRRLESNTSTLFKPSRKNG